MFRVHSVSQRPNLRHLGEPLGGAKSLLEAVCFKKATEGMGIECQMGASSTLWGPGTKLFCPFSYKKRPKVKDLND